MPVKRGDVVLTFVENVGSQGGKVRPALIIQNDELNNRLNETIIAAVTSNTSNVMQPNQLLIHISTNEGIASGLLHDSAIRCERLHTIPQADVRRTIGRLSDKVMNEIDSCLTSALGIR